MNFEVCRNGLSIFLSITILSISVICSADITQISERTTQVQSAIIAAADVNSAADVTETRLVAITSLNLRSKSITSLKSGDFSGMTGLTSLNLYNNELSSLPDGIFKGLTALTTLRLGSNSIDPFPISVTLEKVGDTQVKAVAPTGATFDYVLTIRVANGSISEDASTLTIRKGNTESNTLTVTRTAETTDAVTVDIETLPSLSRNHYGYTLSKSDDLPIEVISAVSIEPETPDEPLIPETPDNTAPESPDNSEVPENKAPIFSDGAITVRTVTENTIANTNIGMPVTATDADEDTLTYSLSGTLAASFDIVSATGQLLTKVALDYEVMSVYPLTVTVSDGTLTDTITVVISIIDELETAFVSMSVPVSERTAQVRDAIVNAVPNISNAEDVTTDHLAAITALDLRNKGITELKSGDFFGLSGLTNLNLFNNMLTRLPVGTFSGLTSLTTLRLGGNLIDPLPLIISLQQVAVNQYQAVISTASPFNIELPINVTDGSISGNTANVVIEKGNIYSDTFTVIPTSTMSLPIVDIDTLPAIPVNHYGYILTKSVVCNRTSQVAEGIAAAVPNVEDCNNVTEVDIAIITSLNLSDMSITSLHSDDFAGLFSLTTLNLSKNNLTMLPNGIFSSLGALNSIDLSENTVDPIPVNISLLKIGENGIKVVIPTGATFDIVLPLTIQNGSLEDGTTTITIPKTKTESDIPTVTRTLDTIGAVTVDIGSLPDLPMEHTGYALVKTNETPLGIYGSIKVAPVFSDGDSTSRSITENTEAGVNIGDAVSATDANNDTLMYSLGGTDAAVFDIDSITGQLMTKNSLDYETKITYSVTITVSDGELTDSIEVTINVTDLEEVVKTPNTDPVFTDGESTTRTIAENATIGSDIGTPVSATDTDDDKLTYSLSGTDASSFSLDSSTGQLKTNALLDYETQSSYTVTVSVSDDEDGSDSITVTINVTDVDENLANNAPEFTDGDEATRTVAENTALGVNLGDPFSATDEDEDTLTYSLSGTDAASFSLDSTTGQLKTNEPLDYERKTSYSVVISVSDGKGGSDSITVTINVTDVDESLTNNPPVFTEGELATRTIAENTLPGVNIGEPVSATDADEDTLTYGLSGTDATAFGFDNSTGQLQTNTPLDFETKPTHVVTISVSDGQGGSATITVTINVTDVEELPENNDPVFTDGNEATRSVEENTATGVNIGDPVSATDADGDNLIYSLSGPDASLFGIDTGTAQLQTSSDLDFETQSEYSVIVNVSDGNGGIESIVVTISVTNVNEVPEFDDGDSTLRTIAENTQAGVNIGVPISATDLDGDTLTYSLGGTDANSFDIDTSTGQLLTKDELDFETKDTYTVTVSVDDNNGESDSIDVTITLIDLDEVTPNANAPVFNEGSLTSRSISENASTNVNVGSPVTATDQDSPTLSYQLSGTDASAFSIDGATGQIKTNASLNRESRTSYSVTVIASDGELSSSIAVTINITDINEPPVFDDGTHTSRSINENTPAGVDIDRPLSATDDDLNTTLVYSIPRESDAALFDIDASTGQLKTKVPLNSEDAEYEFISVEVSDGEFTDYIRVRVDIWDINDAPVFTEGDEGTTRTIDENTPSAVNIGGPVSATDEDIDLFTNLPDTLTYSLDDGTDASAFSIDSSTGQISTSGALDHETQETYTVTVTVTDNDPGSTQPGDPGVLTDTIEVTISIGDVNEAPTFNDGEDTSRSIDENSPSGTPIGTPISASDVDDGDVLTYTMTGTNASSFTIDSGTGQISTSAPLNFEETNTFSVTVTVTDNGGPAGPSGGTLSDTIPVTINVNDINDAPVFTEGEAATRNIDENTTSNVNIGGVVAATDEDTNPVDTLSYSLDSSSDAAAFSIDSSTGQIQTSSALDHETQDSYSFTVTVSDQRSTALMDTINITIDINDINETPVFTENDPAGRDINENTAANVNIGSAVGATDEDEGADDSTPNTLTYSLGGTDMSSFDIDTSSGQLKTKAALNFETKNAYEVTITVSDNQSPALTDTITVNITINDVNDAPVFPASETGARNIDENTAADTPIGGAVAADDEDMLPSADTLTYSLGGTDMSSFDIESTSGQIKTKTALDFETKSSYSVDVTVTDDGSDPGLTDTITVTISVNDVNDAPVFSDSKPTTRSIDENTATDTNIGTAVSATDEDTLPSADTLTYTLSGTDAASFDIDSSSGQIKTKAALDHETDDSLSVTVTVTDDGSDPGLTDTIDVTININDVNEAPEFTATTATRSVNENVTAGTNIGAVVSASDVDDGDSLTYALSGTDASDFDIVSTSGQLQTKSDLDHETEDSYTVIVTATDTATPGLTDMITVTINVNDVNDTPKFDDGTSATRSIDENTAANMNIGDAVGATDEDKNDDNTQKDTLTYTLEGTDAASFNIVSTSGQLQTKAALDKETKDSYSVTVKVTDDSGDTSTNSATISVTITVTNVNEAPEFLSTLTTTISVDENTAANTEIGNAFTATDVDSGDTLTYSLEGTDKDEFAIDETSGQLKTKEDLNYEVVDEPYSVTVKVTDSGDITDTIDVTININDVNDAPEFTDGETTTRSIVENRSLGSSVGDPVTATDEDKDSEDNQKDTLIYSLSGTDADKFTIDSSTGQIRIAMIFTVDMDTEYTVVVTVQDRPDDDETTEHIDESEGKLTDTITVTITVTNIGGAPALTPVPTQTALLSNYPNPFNPETWIPYQLSKPSDVTLTIYNLRGVVVREIAISQKPAGNYISRNRAMYWDGRNSLGEKVAAGVYFYTFKTRDYSATRKMLIRK